MRKSELEPCSILSKFERTFAQSISLILMIFRRSMRSAMKGTRAYSFPRPMTSRGRQSGLMSSCVDATIKVVHSENTETSSFPATNSWYPTTNGVGLCGKIRRRHRCIVPFGATRRSIGIADPLSPGSPGKIYPLLYFGRDVVEWRPKTVDHEGVHVTDLHDQDVKSSTHRG